MKNTTTITIDAELKEKAMPIIQNQMDTSLSAVVNDRLKEIIKNGGKK